MYKRFVICVVALVIVTGPFVYADSATTELSDYQIEHIKANCITVQSTLSRIHANDGLSRIHLAQEYETISSKFMAPMNSRVALAKLNGIALTKTTVAFNEKLSEFRNIYKLYEQTLYRTIQIKCVDQPVDFYSSLIKAQSGRVQVRQVTTDLADLVKQYQQEVRDVRMQSTPTGSTQ